MKKAAGQFACKVHSVTHCMPVRACPSSYPRFHAGDSPLKNKSGAIQQSWFDVHSQAALLDGDIARLIHTAPVVVDQLDTALVQLLQGHQQVVLHAC